MEQLRRMWSGRPEDSGYRSSVRTMCAQSIGLQRAQRRVRLLPPIWGRGTRPRAAPAPADEIRVYQPSTRPGALPPHAWIHDEDGRRRRSRTRRAAVPADRRRAWPGLVRSCQSSSPRRRTSRSTRCPRLRSPPRSARSSPGRSARRPRQLPDMAIRSRPAGTRSLSAPPYCISTVFAEPGGRECKRPGLRPVPCATGSTLPIRPSWPAFPPKPHRCWTASCPR